jgi:hypothetical protein
MATLHSVRGQDEQNFAGVKADSGVLMSIEGLISSTRTGQGAALNDINQDQLKLY